MMKRRIACKQTGLWPDVIADLIGAYAEYTTMEKYRALIGNAEPHSFALHTADLKLVLTAALGCIWIHPAAGGKFILTMDEFCNSADAGMWDDGLHGIGLYAAPARAMTEGELRDIRGWLARVE